MDDYSSMKEVVQRRYNNLLQNKEQLPNLIVAEPTDLIGTGTTSDSNYVIETIKTVSEINPDIMVLQGAGISNGEDVYNTIKLGAQATGSTSGILKAKDPYAMVEEMLYNLRRAWNELHP